MGFLYRFGFFSLAGFELRDGFVNYLKQVELIVDSEFFTGRGCYPRQLVICNFLRLGEYINCGPSFWFFGTFMLA